MEINERIFLLLDKKEKTASELSKFLHVSPSSVSAWRNEGSFPSSKYIVRISEFLEVSPQFLITGKENETYQTDNFTFSNEEKEIITQWRKLSYTNKTILKGELYRFVKEKDVEYSYENLMVAE